MTEWIDMGSYKISTYEQGTKEWLNLRKGLVTSSNFSTVNNKNRFKSRKEYGEQLRNGTKDVFSEKSIEHMNRGTTLEPCARELYESITGQKVTEVGIAIPKWNPRIGASSDGFIGEDGLLEIKCPAKMYRINPNHIYPNHYDQIQGCMAVTGKRWCDYFVYCDSDNTYYLKRIEFNQKYWDDILYPSICSFIEEYL